MRLIVTLIISLAMTCANAQVRKCVGPSGKITYSDSLCESGNSTTVVRNLEANNLDNSGSRQQVEAAAVERNREEIIRNPPIECRFKSHSRDEKGRALANRAQEECIQNLLAKQKGGSKNNGNYELWKDNYDQISARREAAANRAVSSMNAQEIARSNSALNNRAMIVQPDKTLVCRRGVLGDTLNCK